jgi:hypothetical protein
MLLNKEAASLFYFYAWKQCVSLDTKTVKKVKVKLSLCFNRAPHHEGAVGSGGIAPLILDLGTRWK